MNNVRTVSDTKRAFYGQHTRPVNALYRRVVEELMVEMHLLLVNVDFRYDAIYALGVVTTYDRFMQGYEPERDRTSIYNALISAVEEDPSKYRQDAEAVLSAVKSRSSLQAFEQTVEAAKSSPGSDILTGSLHQAISNDKFKYSRLFAVGFYTLLESVGADELDDKEKRDALLDEQANILGINADLLKKDVELYRSNLEKMAQAQEVMKDMIAAEKKKQAQREEEKRKRAEKKAASEQAAADADTAESVQASAESTTAESTTAESDSTEGDA